MSTNDALRTCDRRFHWVSSVVGSADTLSELNRELTSFYGEQDRRALYQAMLCQQDQESPDQNSVRYLMPKYVCDQYPTNILEIGCGDGRVYRQLCSYGYGGRYVGTDVADYLIRDNEQRHREAEWRVAHAYKIPFSDDAFDLCFSLYVLEHLVYPEAALREMVRILRPGGRLVLVFPDIAQSGRLGSQQLGFSPIGSAKDKLRNGRLIDALVSLFDSRLRLPRALRNASSTRGPFPVNTRPICLYHSSLMAPDIDAVYIASKKEVQSWGEQNGLAVEYPCGVQGEFAEQAFIVLHKR